MSSSASARSSGATMSQRTRDAVRVLALTRAAAVAVEARLFARQVTHLWLHRYADFCTEELD